jgi:lysophospholipase L1-like esterase
MLAALAAGSVVAGRTASAVRRMRQAAASTEVLDHDVDLPGRRPARRLTVVGDSAAAGHGIVSPDDALPRRLGRALATDGTAVEVRCLAEDGATAQDVVEQQVPALAPSDVVVIGVGVNDALRRHPTAMVRRDTRGLLEAVAAASPAAVRVLVTCPDLGVAPGLPAAVRGVVGWRCRTVAAAQCVIADELGVAAVRLDRGVLRPELFGSDGFHPGREGIRELVELIVAHLPSHVGGRR